MKAELGRALLMGGSQLCSEGDELDVEALAARPSLDEDKMAVRTPAAIFAGSRRD